MTIRTICAFAALMTIASCGGPGKADDPSDVTSRLMTDATGIDDESFSAAGWKGMLAYYGDSWDNPEGKGRLYDWITVPSHDLFVPSLKQVSDQGYGLVIVSGFMWDTALAEVAPLYPGQKYLIIDVKWLDGPNIMQASFAEHEGSYLVGLAAALKARADGIATPRFGFIGGVPGRVITRFEMGWIQGIRSVYPDAGFVDYYANAWNKPELAKAQARAWYDSGVYAIFSAAGATGNGTIAQAKEYRLSGRNVWAVGVDGDQHRAGVYADGKSAVLTSMLKRVDRATEYALRSVRDGSFEGRVYEFGAANGGVDFAVTNPELGDAIVAAVNAAKAGIIDGSVVVVPGYAEAKSLGLAPDGLMARDD